jgi:hypothetical protein
MDAASKVVRKISLATLAALGKFKGFRHEPLHEVRAKKVETNPAIGKMREAWKACKPLNPDDFRNTYADMVEKIGNPNHCAKDIETFCIVLAGFQDETDFSIRAGLYLSALINNCEGDGFVIPTSHFTEPIQDIGFRNTKRITVKGNAGDSVGSNMEGGIIVVEGDAGGSVGINMVQGSIVVRKDAGDTLGMFMKGGSIIVAGNIGDDAGWSMDAGAITVKGNAGENLGRNMRGGVISVNGDAGESVGLAMKNGIITVGGDAGDNVCLNMEGGEVHINGSVFGSIYDGFIGGRIFHKGELIIDK